MSQCIIMCRMILDNKISLQLFVLIVIEAFMSIHPVRSGGKLETLGGRKGSKMTSYYL